MKKLKCCMSAAWARSAVQSLAVMAQGFLNYQAVWMERRGRARFLDIACTQTGGEGHVRLRREILEQDLEKRGLKFFCSLPQETLTSFLPATLT